MACRTPATANQTAQAGSSHPPDALRADGVQVGGLHAHAPPPGRRHQVQPANVNTSGLGGSRYKRAKQPTLDGSRRGAATRSSLQHTRPARHTASATMACQGHSKGLPGTAAGSNEQHTNKAHRSMPSSLANRSSSLCWQAKHDNYLQKILLTDQCPAPWQTGRPRCTAAGRLAAARCAAPRSAEG